MPENLQGLSKYTPAALKAVLCKYYIAMTFELIERFRSIKDEWQRFSVIMQVICDPKLLEKVLAVYDLEV